MTASPCKPENGVAISSLTSAVGIFEAEPAYASASDSLAKAVVFPGLYSSMATWKLAPPKPKEETFALLILSVFHSSAWVITLIGLSLKSTVLLRFLKLMEGGNVLLCKARAVFTMLTAPAAALVWPICDLIEPNATEFFGIESPEYISCKTLSSEASPAFVAVP